MARLNLWPTRESCWKKQCFCHNNEVSSNFTVVIRQIPNQLFTTTHVEPFFCALCTQTHPFLPQLLLRPPDFAMWNQTRASHMRESRSIFPETRKRSTPSFAMYASHGCGTRKTRYLQQAFFSLARETKILEQTDRVVAFSRRQTWTISYPRRIPLTSAISRITLSLFVVSN